MRSARERPFVGHSQPYPEVKVDSYDTPKGKDYLTPRKASQDAATTRLSIASIAMALKRSADGHIEQFIHTPTTPVSDAESPAEDPTNEDKVACANGISVHRGSIKFRSAIFRGNTDAPESSSKIEFVSVDNIGPRSKSQRRGALENQDSNKEVTGNSGKSRFERKHLNKRLSICSLSSVKSAATGLGKGMIRFDFRKSSQPPFYNVLTPLDDQCVAEFGR